MPPQVTRPAPKWARKRYVLPALGFAFIIGIMAAGASDPQTKTVADDKPQPTATSTVTATATATETAEPEPAPTVTATETVKVRVTITAGGSTGGSGGGSSNDDSGSGGGSVYYRNCDAARAAGAAPVRVGDPGYGRHLDRDGDGIGCE
ncbi:excalibur calcium-binding domain-containing protein [Streptomyces sp. NPDC091292]|uniref:excalibur calcium-binding domain-containing protein n=1 Tax=Streptomyces sp. NPDC091292 TaxID=3365991 RepID=UPI003821DADA